MKIHSDLLRRLRLYKHWSQEQLSDACGLSVRTIQRVENTGQASLESIKVLADVFGIEPSTLIVHQQDVNNTPMESIKTCFMKYANFSDTTSKSEFWWFFLPYSFCKSQTGQATYAQFCIKQDWLLLPIPEDISYKHAMLACCGLGSTFNAMQQMSVNAFDTVLISGLGAVGLGAVVNARCRGARVLCLENNEYRAALATALGVEAVIDPQDEHQLERILELTAGCGVDKSLETSGAETAPAFLLQATRRRGHVALVGWGGPMMVREIIAKGLTIYGIWHWNHHRDAEAMFRTIRQSRFMLDRIITHVFAMRDVKNAWDLQLTGKCGKIILHPWD